MTMCSSQKKYRFKFFLYTTQDSLNRSGWLTLFCFTAFGEMSAQDRGFGQGIKLKFTSVNILLNTVE